MTTTAPEQRPSSSAPACAVVQVLGDLDLRSLPRVREQLHEALVARHAQVVVDLQDCGFVDASGLGALLDAHRRAARYGGELALRGCSTRVLRLLSLTGLRRVFTLQDGGPAQS